MASLFDNKKVTETILYIEKYLDQSLNVEKIAAHAGTFSAFSNKPQESQ